MPRTLATPAPRSADSLVTVRGLARERGCTVHRVLSAVALGELRARRIGGRVFITSASAAGWAPAARDAAPTAA
jgi:hypothetical protein